MRRSSSSGVSASTSAGVRAAANRRPAACGVANIRAAGVHLYVSRFTFYEPTAHVSRPQCASVAAPVRTGPARVEQPVPEQVIHLALGDVPVVRAALHAGHGGEFA